ncbi:MAG: hypothetical protein GY699_19825 [Desulfobacteraceae bacterium]|nr:hypothetical protein [Desulfobacteraceae bacterium]
MKSLFVILFAFVCITLCNLAQVQAATTTFGLRFDFTNAGGSNVGLGMFTFNAVDLNSWIDVGDLENFTVSGIISDTREGYIFNLGKQGTSHHFVGQLSISDANPTYSVTFSNGAEWASAYWATMDFSSYVTCFLNLETGEWKVEDILSGTNTGTFTTSVWFNGSVPSEVPIPSAFLMLASGVLGLAGVKRIK